MSTPANLLILDERDNPLLAAMVQCDGYPEGFGFELARYLKRIKITCGVTDYKSMGRTANGMQCLAAQVVRHFKRRVGYLYILPPPIKHDIRDFLKCEFGFSYLVQLGADDRPVLTAFDTNGQMVEIPKR